MQKEQLKVAEYQATCVRCKRLFAMRFPLPQDTRWFAVEVNRYCEECNTTRCKLVVDAHLEILRTSTGNGSLIVSQNDMLVDVKDVEYLFTPPLNTLAERLDVNKIDVKPLDWWHQHYGLITARLSSQGWTEPRHKVVLEIMPNETLSVPISTDGLPKSALVDLFKLGEYKLLAELPERTESVEDRDILCKMAEEHLDNETPQGRYGALYILVILNCDCCKAAFLDYASRPQEHVAVRGLALRGLAESFFDLNCDEQEKAVILMETLMFDSSAELRWWAAYAVHHFPGSSFDIEESPKYEPLLKALKCIVDDPIPAGLGWAVGLEAQDAIAHWERGVEAPLRPIYRLIDPWKIPSPQDSR